MKKKLLAIILVLCMALTLLPVAALAEGGGETPAGPEAVSEQPITSAQGTFKSAYDPETGKVPWATLVAAVTDYNNSSHTSETKAALKEYYASITKLDLSGTTSWENAGPIVPFTGLTELNLSNSNFPATDSNNALHALAGFCSKLESLDISGCKSIEILTGLPAIESLKTSLKTLKISGSGVTDISPLETMTALETLDISDTGITNFNVVNSLTNLKNLDMSGIKLASAASAPLAGCTKLETLIAKNTNLTEIAGLQDCAALQTVDLSGSASLTDINGLGPKSGTRDALTSINLSKTGLADAALPALAKCPNLVDVDLSGNASLTDFAALAQCTKLEKINLSGTGLDTTHLAPLVNLENVKDLDISNTKVDEINTLAVDSSEAAQKISQSLVTLNISGTKLKKFETNWVKVDESSGNKTISPRFPALKHLIAKDLQELDSISGLADLVCVDPYKGNKAEVIWDLGGGKVTAPAGQEDVLGTYLWWLTAELGDSFIAPSAVDSTGQAITGGVPENVTKALNHKANFEAKLNNGTLKWSDILRAVYWYEEGVKAANTVSNADIKANLTGQLEGIKQYYGSITKLDMSGHDFVAECQEVIDSSNSTQPNLGMLSMFTGLTELNLSNCNLPIGRTSDANMSNVVDLGVLAENIKGIKTLNLSGNENVKGESLGALVDLSITDLNLSGTGIGSIAPLTSNNNAAAPAISNSLAALDISDTAIDSMDVMWKVGAAPADGTPSLPALKTLTAKKLNLKSIAGLVEIVSKTGFDATGIKWDITESSLASSKLNDDYIDRITEKLGENFKHSYQKSPKDIFDQALDAQKKLIADLERKGPDGKNANQTDWATVENFVKLYAQAVEELKKLTDADSYEYKRANNIVNGTNGLIKTFEIPGLDFSKGQPAANAKTEVLKDFKELVMLNLTGTGVTELDGLAGMTKLASLTASGLNLSSVKGLTDLTKAAGFDAKNITKWDLGECIITRTTDNETAVTALDAIDNVIPPKFLGESDKVEIVPAVPEVNTEGASIPDDKKDAVVNAVTATESNIATQDAVSKLVQEEAAKITDEEAANNIAKAEEAAGGSTSNPKGYNKVQVSTYLEMKIGAYEETTEGAVTIKALTVDITPMYKTQVVKVKNDGTVDDSLNPYIVSKKPLTDVVKANNLTVELQVGLPKDFVEKDSTTGTYHPVYVSHIGYEYKTKSIREIKNETSQAVESLLAIFDNPHGFSSFTITTKSNAVAKIDDVSYTTLQAAVDAVKDNGEITVLSEGELEAKVSGAKTFTLKPNPDLPYMTLDKVTLTASNGYKITTETNNGEMTVKSEISGTVDIGGLPIGGGTSTPSSTVTAPATVENGKVTVDKTSAKQGDTVTITVTPDEGYELDKLTVTDANGKEVEVTKTEDGKYTFKMPATAVKVEASFKAKTSGSFVDVKEDDWFYEAVKYASDNGMMNGVGDNKFDPMGTTNRAMIVTMVHRLEGTPSAPASSFTDVPADEWYTDAVNWAASTGIVTGFSPEIFDPLKDITREQMAAILYRYAQYKGYDVSAADDLSGFTDAANVSGYALPAMRWAVAEGLINGMGDNTLAPDGIANRAQVAAIFMRFCENVAK